MIKYFSKPSKPKAAWHDDEPLLPSLTVYESENKTHFSGLYDSEGNELHRDLKISIGFDLSRKEIMGKKKKGGGAKKC